MKKYWKVGDLLRWDRPHSLYIISINGYVTYTYDGLIYPYDDHKIQYVVDHRHASIVSCPTQKILLVPLKFLKEVADKK